MRNSRLVCFEANILVWSLVPFPLSDMAEALLTQWKDQNVTLVAPALFAFEVASSLRRLVYMKYITPAEGETAFQRFLATEIHLSSHPRIFPLAWELARQFGRPRIYDTTYLALAQLHGCDFWTADQRLYDVVHADLPWVHWLGHFTPGASADVAS